MRQLVRRVSFGLTENMKPLVNLESEVFEKRTYNETSVSVIHKLQFYVSGIQALNLDL